MDAPKKSWRIRFSLRSLLVAFTAAAVLTMALGEDMANMDRLFARRSPRSGRSRTDEMMGEFVLEGDANLGTVADLYAFRVPRSLRALTVGDFLRSSLMKAPQPGYRLHIGEVEFIVRAVDSGAITRVGLDLDPPPTTGGRFDLLRINLVASGESLRRMVRRRKTNLRDA